ncbi:MAG: 50S ribosomal protein L9 [Planctomycetes bacterium]|nr:50S ribosomal protein L9 [Planctomycetota bacterium]MCB9910877.1 50S ribosomal protein L9 [Planctomycetota bacterium]MCB9912088.1 50S ribosomal protein L9 [Planctomycetota bacterium]HPF14476.1 50S ribosomal protein L9 [Planctomycetota bacterium]HRV80539.1 50S ribosomal protein L9 [Planctomycetota bacterium]
MAKRFEVLLKEDVKDLGNVGDVVRVASGYARNYLLPFRLAIPANEDNKRQIARRAARAAAERAERDKSVAATIAALGELVVSTTERADSGGNLYGSVSAAQIAVLVSQAGTPLEEKQVRMDAAIKQTGDHKVRIHVFGDQEALITVRVEAQA